MSAPAKSPLALIFLTILIDMIGFGIMIPVLPVYAASPQFLATEAQLGWLIGIYSLLQLICSPLFGRISDRVGRKPVLVVSIFGTMVGFLVLGFANSLWMLFLGRIIDGASGGNISTAQACIADVTPPEDRSKAMGLIGVAFGLGFILGPALGGWLSAAFNPSTPFFVAAALALINALLVWMRLPETHGLEHRVQAHEKAKFGEVFSQGRGRLITTIILSYLTSITGFSMMTALFALFCLYRFGYSEQNTGLLLGYVGLLGVLVQGGLLRRLLKRPIEKELAIIGSLILAASMFTLPFTPPALSALMIVCAGIALGNGFVTPTLNGLASRHVDRRTQGRVLGLMQSAGSLGRFLGPMLAFWLVQGDSRSSYGNTAFWASAGILLMSTVLILTVSAASPAATTPVAAPEPAG